ncbi:alginate export family protein [Methylocystis sp. IM2]|uniref:alginate export family protein n=1 Tax=Methylocystis sp. IM2 TaxID=3136563 RepID=UPI0030FCEB45
MHPMAKLRHLKLGAAVAALAVSTGVVRAEEGKAPESVKEAASSQKGGQQAGAQKGVDAKTAAAKTGAAKPEEKKPEEKKSYYVPTRGYRLEPQPEIPPMCAILPGPIRSSKESIGSMSASIHACASNIARMIIGPGPTRRPRRRRRSGVISRTRSGCRARGSISASRTSSTRSGPWSSFRISRAFNSIYQLQGQEINQTDLISAYGELYFKDAFGKDPRGNDRPLTVRAGRFHFELLDRRLIAENEFRNTTNNFEGFRVKVGKKDNDWDLDSFFMRPVVRLPYQFDRPDWQNWVYGSVFSFRRFSEYVTVQPYYLGRIQYGDPSNPSTALKTHRETYAPGLRMYGVIGNFDYDFDINKQFGAVGRLQTAAPYLGTNTAIQFTPTSIAQVTAQNSAEVTVPFNALAWGLELGYTFSDHPWKPRISTVYVYGSGSGSPFNYSNSNFDIFYGFNQPFSRNDYFAWNNIKDPKIRLEFTPAKNLQIDTAFSAYWLASPANAWDRANLFAPLGNRGNFLGTEFDIRARYKLSQFVNITASYARFWPGSFTSSFAPPVAFQQWPAPYSNAAFGVTQTGTTWGLTSKPTDFFYLEATANAFGDGQPITKDPVTQLWGAVGPGGKPPAPSWRDIYVGLNGGGAWSNPTTQTVTAAVSPTVASEPIAQASRLLDGGNRLAGFVGGLQLGANWRFDPGVVAGLEADLRGVSGNTDTTMQGSVIGVGKTRYVNYGQRTTTLNYLGTIRGRLGYLPTATLQLYGTGGLAYGGVISNTALFTAPNGNPTVSNWTLSSAQFADSLIGWTAGGGVEWMFMPNWSAKAEYLYYNLGNATATGYNALRFSGANVGLPNVAYNYGLATRTKFDGNLVQAGINRHFDLFAED